MANTGNVFPTVGATVDRAGSTLWTNPGNVVSDNATNATSTVPTDYLVTSGYGFAIPAGAVIRGVTVRIEMAETGTGSSNYIPQLHSNTTPTLIGAAKSAITITTGPTISTSGGIGDLWSATLTPAIVNAAGFGVSIWSTDTINALQCDFVTIAIEYTEVPNAWDSRQYFRKRKNLTHRRRVDAHWNEDYPASPPPASVDRTLEAPFVTRVFASKRAQSMGWMAALTAQGVAPPSEAPITAWLAPVAIRRRETERKVQAAPDVVVERYTPPAIAWFPLKVIEIAFERKLQAQAPQLLFPPTTGPPPVEQYPAWATKQRAPTFQERRLQGIEHDVFPVTPAAPTVQIAAVTLERRKRRKHRPGLFLSGGGLVEARIQPQYPSYATQKTLKRRATERRLQSALGIPSAPAAPAAPTQPITAWLGRRADRVEHERQRLDVRHDVYPATPAVPAQPPSAWRAPVQHWIEQARKLQKAAPQLTHPQTPAVAAQPESAFRARVANWIERERRLIPQAPQITYPPSPPSQPVTAWRLATANRIERRRTLLQPPPIASTIKAQPPEATPRVDAIRRSETARTRQVAAHAPFYRPTPAPFQQPSSWKLAEAFRRHGWRTVREVLELDEHPETDRSRPTDGSTSRSRRRNRTLNVAPPERTAKGRRPKRTETT